jgi:SprT-like family
LLTLASVRKSDVRNPSKHAVTLACLFIILIGAWVVATVEERREQERVQRDRDFAIKLLHDTDLIALYEQINRVSFGGQLRADVPVSWANLRSDRDCGKCGAMTDYDSGRPAIRIDNERVRTENSLRLLMQHEMCHVAVIDAATKLRQDSHGPLWRECMKRFE